MVRIFIYNQKLFENFIPEEHFLTFMSISPLIDTWYIDLFGFVFAFVYCTTSSVLSDTHVADLCGVVLVPIWHQEAL